MIIRIDVETRTLYPGVMTWAELIDTVTACAPVDQRTPILEGSRQTRAGTIRVYADNEDALGLNVHPLNPDAPRSARQ